MSTRPRRLGLWIPWGIFAALCVGWCIYWAVIADAARQGLERVVAAQVAAGAELRIGQTHTRGFPLQLALELEDIAYVRPGRTLSAATERIVAHINPMNPLQVLIDFPSPIDITRSDVPHRVTARGLQASVRIRARDRALAQAGIGGTDLVMRDLETGAIGLEAAEIVFNMRPDPRAANETQGALLARGLRLKGDVRGFEGLGREIATFNAALVLEHSDALSWRGDPFYAWREAGGAARIEGITIEWSGVRAEGRGRLTLDGERRLSGALSMDVEGPSAALRRIATAPERQAQRPALETLAVSMHAAPRATLGFLAADGALSLNGIELRDLAPLYGAP